MLRIGQRKATFSPQVSEQEFHAFLETVLEDDRCHQPLSNFLVSYFRKFVAPEDDYEAPLIGFSFWDNDSDSQSARLISGDGFDYQSAEYPKLLQYGEGIVGTLLSRFSDDPEIVAYVSGDYKKDPYLTAVHTVTKRFGFKSGIAFPIFLRKRLAGVFKVYCR